VRVLVCEPGPNFSVQDVFNGWVEALRELGQDVIEHRFSRTLTFYNEALLPAGGGEVKKAMDIDQAAALAVDRICAALYKVRPDVLLLVSGFLLPPELLDAARSYGTKVVLLHTECPYEDERQLQLAPHADLNLVNDPTGIEAYRAVAPTEYVPHAYRPALHSPGDPDPALACDLAFVGTAYPSRVAFLRRMDLTGLDVLLAGNWQSLGDDDPLLPFVAHALDECLDNTGAVDIYRSARAGLNLYRREGEKSTQVAGWAMGPREVEMAACGLFFLRDPRGEGDEVLDMLPTVASPEDASEQLRWWLDHPQERQELALKARSAIADRTFENHAAAVLRLLT
jgi:spore maturation protein CgeB